MVYSRSSIVALHKARVLALAPADDLAEVQALRAERDELRGAMSVYCPFMNREGYASNVPRRSRRGRGGAAA
jgi:hypothetical protein